ncbi:S1 family peptidase [Cellulomonas sp. NS3]|uniref:S1 family peptidase n=1 Tax=Cellulomonas sp. NS3 TaxID=2973977 RepID=UPI002162F0D0|nr:S1 family peptidase [Cellulomonas sp. NS3]
MDRDEAREIKSQLADYVHELAQREVHASGVATDTVPALGLGLAPVGEGRYAVAVRYRLGSPRVRAIARRVAEQIGPVGADVRRTGRIRPLAQAAAAPDRSTDGAASPDGPAPLRTGPRPPVITALAAGETARVRPLRPGISIAHVDVSAGTLGAFVQVDGVLHALSNYHVLAGSPAAQVGDVIVQPGPADGGRAPRDRVGTLAATVPLTPGRTATVDAAVALLDEQDVDLDYPVGRVTRTAVALGGEDVVKIGRTTAVTTGRVTAIELDDIVVGYGEELGDLRFDDQIEVESTGPGPFSRGGDSGSLVCTRDGIALGLLFAGSETGGDNGTGLTYLNPIDTVLAALGAELAQ